MTIRVPFIDVKGPSGVNLAERFGDEFVGVRITDLDGGEADELVIRFRRRKPYLQPPPVDTEFTAALGWDPRGALVTGTYKYQRTQYSGDPEGGQEMNLVCRSADFTDALKRVDTEHFDAETGHRTYGDVLDELARRAGLSTAIDDELRAIPLAGGYLLRWKQSAIGFASDIAEELGAIVKPQAGRLTARRKGSFASPSGSDLPDVRIPFDPNYAWQVDLEPRFGQFEVAAGWFDAGKGRPEETLKALGNGIARFAMPHIAPSIDFAKAAAEGTARRLEAETATGFFQFAGDATAVAGARAVAEGYGPDVDAVNWEIRAVYHEAGPDMGWTTTIETELAW
ncbi:phage-related tail protein [Fulvimarina pelagi HTCC2506]|uniref:Phage-related tail protein n=1 Tax=Fulvimarina pelagi HTCC2506 TaxID=314231 RepID=Q0FZ18_9HYPH|nr:hypothetical protein [Fulvimarina pelagi]EAU40140.1 phage-related tail protein [Fulvimarina pelagi HTCC2506]